MGTLHHHLPQRNFGQLNLNNFGRKSLGDDEHSVRPKTATIDENIAKVHQDDRRIKVKEIAEVINMSKGRVCHILNQHLAMKKLSARWVPR